MNIPLSKPEITPEDVAAVSATLKSGKLTQGPQTSALEEMVAAYVGASFAIATSSHATALHTALLARGIGTSGSAEDVAVTPEIVTGAFAFVAAANCIEQIGAKPVFADIDPISLNVDTHKVVGALNENSRAVLIPHTFGLPAESARLCGEAEEYGLTAIEDASQALGAAIGGERVGACKRSLAAVFSFYPGCPITTGEGGMVVTNDETFANTCRSLVNLGRQVGAPVGGGKGAGWLEHPRVGFNYRMDEMSAALGVSQLARIDETLTRRQRIADHYRGRLRELKGKFILPMEISGYTRAWSTFNVVCREGVSREKVTAALGEKGIATERYFDPPLHLQKFYREKYGFARGMLPITEGMAAQIFAVPFFTTLSVDEVDYICDALTAATA
ncbi:MAG: DegT/DnrJ/EryC1/StrS aminotransferase family protein [Planctomycetes bacterium]|nr:DegT/DnrJ/EryC1/StrS aminotransferase family protein [Planctomycetota bacterium]